MAVQVSLSGQLQIADLQNASAPFIKNLLSLLFSGSVLIEAQGQSLANGANVISLAALPATGAQFVYIKNLHASQTIQITWTPQGGAGAIVATLRAGAVLILIETDTLAGITALTLTASGAATTVEYILAG